MADMTMCTDKECPNAQRCKRIHATPARFQSYAAFPRVGADCEYFIEIEAVKNET